MYILKNLSNILERTLMSQFWEEWPALICEPDSIESWTSEPDIDFDAMSQKLKDFQNSLKNKEITEIAEDWNPDDLLVDFDKSNIPVKYQFERPGESDSPSQWGEWFDEWVWIHPSIGKSSPNVGNWWNANDNEGWLQW